MALTVQKSLAQGVKVAISRGLHRRTKAITFVYCFHTQTLPLCKDKVAENNIVLYDGKFEESQQKNKESFLKVIDFYKKHSNQHQAHIDFIRSALKYMKEYGVHRDLETYKRIIDIMPKEKYVPTNRFQVIFQHFPVQQQLIVDVLDQMERNQLMPDREMEDILLNIFGERGLPLHKYWRMMYWMPKFKYINPYRVEDEVLADPKALSKFALIKMTSKDPQAKVTKFETKDLPDATEDTWIMSCMSSSQEELLAVLPSTDTLFIEGPEKIWCHSESLDYFVLRGKKIERKIVFADIYDIDKIEIPYHNIKGREGIPLSVYEQGDGTYYAMCITGTSSKESLVSWIRFLEKKNPNLTQVPVVFKIRSCTDSGEIVEQPLNASPHQKQLANQQVKIDE